MKAIVVTDEGAGAAGMTLVERPMPEPAGNDVLVEVHASGFTPGELTWPGTWTDRLGGDRRPSIPGLAGVVRLRTIRGGSERSRPRRCRWCRLSCDTARA